VKDEDVVRRRTLANDIWVTKPPHSSCLSPKFDPDARNN
jgi:hypothetical protein